jgi:hypothetical protein
MWGWVELLDDPLRFDRSVGDSVHDLSGTTSPFSRSSGAYFRVGRAW